MEIISLKRHTDLFLFPNLIPIRNCVVLDNLSLDKLLFANILAKRGTKIRNPNSINGFYYEITLIPLEVNIFISSFIMFSKTRKKPHPPPKSMKLEINLFHVNVCTRWTCSHLLFGLTWRPKTNWMKMGNPTNQNDNTHIVISCWNRLQFPCLSCIVLRMLKWIAERAKKIASFPAWGETHHNNNKIARVCNVSDSSIHFLCMQTFWRFYTGNMQLRRITSGNFGINIRTWFFIRILICSFLSLSRSQPYDRTHLPVFKTWQVRFGSNCIKCVFFLTFLFHTQSKSTSSIEPIHGNCYKVKEKKWTNLITSEKVEIIK